jgi:imidazolonepropionase-like amidohydrolase
MRHAKSAFLILALGLWARGARGQTETTLVLTRALVIDGRGEAPIEDGVVVIRGDRIEAVGPRASVSVPPGARILDLSGRSVMPGLADMHVHLLGGWDGEGVDMLGYRRYLNALLYSGVTTVLDTGNVQPYVLQLRQEIEAGRLPGPRIYCAGPVIDGADPVWPPISASVSSLDQIPKLVSQLKASGVDILKAYVGLSDPMVALLASEGRKVSLPVFVDQWVRNGSIDLVEAGIAAFAHTPVRDLSDDAIATLKEKDIRIITTLAVLESFSRRRLGNLAFLETPLIRDTTPPWFLEELRTSASRPSGEMEAALGRIREGQKNAKKLFDAGVLLAAGTDAPYPGVFQGEGLHRELELLVEAGLTPLEAISVGTRNAARLMNAEREWGTLVAGSLANVVVVRGRPDRNVSESRNIEMVIQKGVPLDREKLRFDPSLDPGFRVSSRVSATPER